MNGPATDKPDKSEEKLNVLVAHVLRVQCEESKEKLLSEEINKFWRLDLLGITEEEKLAKSEDLRDVIFQNGRYMVELPFKKGHPEVGEIERTIR